MNLTALGLLSFVVGTFIVFNAVNFRCMLGNKPSACWDLGAARQAIVAAIAIESLVWAGTGALLGTL